MNLATFSAICVVAGMIATGSFYVNDRFASKEEVSENSIAILWIKLDNAKRDKDDKRVREICWQIQQRIKQKPPGCP